MTPTEIYALTTGGILVLVLSNRLAAVVWRVTLRSQLLHEAQRLLHEAQQHLTLHYAVHRHRYIRPISYSKLLCILVFVGGVAVINVFGVLDFATAARRAGFIVITNLPFLFLASQLPFAADLVGVSANVYYAMHRWLSVIMFVEVGVHVAFALVGSLADGDNIDIYAILASSSIAALGCLAFLRRFAYELSLKLHYGISLLLLCSMFGHIPKSSLLPRTLLYVTAGLLSTTTGMQLCRILYRNIPHRPRIQVDRHGGAAIVSIEILRGWDVHAGQYIQLCMPGITTSSAIESHPFMICWWEKCEKQNLLKIDLLVGERKARSFTTRLSRLVEDQQNRWRKPTVWIDGPFGVTHALQKYSSVILVATGIGIAAQLPFAKEVVRTSSTWSSVTERLVLLWEVENQADVDWVKYWMDDILAEATGGDAVGKGLKNFRIELYNRENRTYGNNDRLEEHAERLEIEPIMKRELERRQGAMFVSVSATAKIRDETREVISKSIDGTITIHNTPFQPFKTQID